MKTFDELRLQAEAIRDAVNENENTAERVGGHLFDTVEKMQSLDIGKVADAVLQAENAAAEAKEQAEIVGQASEVIEMAKEQGNVAAAQGNMAEAAAAAANAAADKVTNEGLFKTQQDLSEEEQGQVKRNLGIEDLMASLETQTIEGFSETVNATTSTKSVDNIILPSIDFAIVDLGSTDGRELPTAPTMSVVLAKVTDGGRVKMQGYLKTSHEEYNIQVISGSAEKYGLNVGIITDIETTYKVFQIRYLSSSDAGKFKGSYGELSQLQSAYPTAGDGSYAFVGNPRHLYEWVTNTWTDRGEFTTSVDQAIDPQSERAIANKAVSAKLTELENNTRKGFATNNNLINAFIEELYITTNDGNPVSEELRISVYTTEDMSNYTLSINGVEFANVDFGLQAVKRDNYTVYILSKNAIGFSVIGDLYYKSYNSNIDLYPIIKQYFFEDKFLNRNVFVNETKISKFIREIYCSGDWDVEDGKIFIQSIKKNHQYGTGIVFENSNKKIIWNYDNADSNNSFIKAINGTKELYAVVDWSVLSDGESYTAITPVEINVYNNLCICPVINQYINNVYIFNQLHKIGKINLHKDAHFKFIVPKDIQSEETSDYLYLKDTQYCIYSNFGLSLNIVGSMGHTLAEFKIKARQLEKWGIKSGDYMSIALKVRVENATKDNYIVVWGSSYYSIRIENNDWNIISYNLKVNYSDINEILDILPITVDNTRTDNKLLYLDGLTICKANGELDVLTDTIEPNYNNLNSYGRNIIADWELKLSERYSKFIQFNTETSKPTKSLEQIQYEGESRNAIVLNYSSLDGSGLAYIQQDVIVCNLKKSQCFRRGIRIRISGKETDGIYATLFQARYRTSWNSENVFTVLFNIGEWIDIFSPSYVINGDEYMHWSYRIQVPKGDYKVEIINPTIIPIEDDIYDCCITGNENSGLPLLTKKWTSLGDSLTDGGGWQLYAQELTGAFPYIRGVGASSIIGDMFPCWINPVTNEHITNILYNAYPPNLDVSTLNNYNDNCVMFKGIFTSKWDIDRLIPSPQKGDYIWWAKGDFIPVYNRRYYNGSSWVDLDDTVVDDNEGILYKTINGRISCEDRVNLIPEDSDIITIMAGTNDGGEAGNVDDYNENTFIGYYRRMIDLIYQRCPKATVIVCLFPKAGSEYDFSNKKLTSSGVKKQEYRDLLVEICKKYGYLLIDMQPASNFQNMSQYMHDDLVHPTDDGHKYWAKIFTAQLLKCINS